MTFQSCHLKVNIFLCPQTKAQFNSMEWVGVKSNMVQCKAQCCVTSGRWEFLIYDRAPSLPQRECSQGPWWDWTFWRAAHLHMFAAPCVKELIPKYLLPEDPRVPGASRLGSSRAWRIGGNWPASTSRMRFPVSARDQLATTQGNISTAGGEIY